MPCVVGCTTATIALTTGQIITLDCTSGEHGLVLAGAVPFEVETLDVSAVPETSTKVTMILGNPDLAFEARCVRCF